MVWLARIAVLAALFACGARTPLDTNNGLGVIGADVGLRLRAPLSTATVTSQTPTLRWILGTDKDGAEVDVCGDRACTSDVTTFTVKGTEGTPPKALAPGVHFWRARSTSAGKVGTVSTPVWEFWVGARSAPTDTSWGTTLDVNGDGLPDLAVGAPLADSNLGKAYVYLGTASGFSKGPQVTLVGKPIPEAPNQGFFGTTIGSAGDLDGDGYCDLFVGAQSDGKDEPLVYIFRGGPSGISTTPAIVLSDHGEGAFQASAAAAGDVNGDGFGDLIVGELIDFESTSDAWVYFGSEDGIVFTSATELAGPNAPGAMSGPIVASAGDIDGDGYGDVFVGADYFVNTGGGLSMVYRGGPGGPSTKPIATISGPNGINLIYGWTPPCAADLDGDGHADLVLRGSTFTGDAYVYQGGPSGIPEVPTTVITAVTPDDGWGVSIATGDLDGDGFADLLVGSNGQANGTGAVYAYLGGKSGVSLTPVATILGPDGEDSFFGSSVAILGDIDGDGLGDFASGAFRFGNDTGRVYIYTKNAATPSLTLDAPDTKSRFGDAVY